jgi:sugar lactone lactonase YvrE
MSRCYAIAALLPTVVMLAACGGSGTSAVPQALAPQQIQGPFLYVGGADPDGDGILSQYRLGDSTPTHTITVRGFVAGMALDHAGRLIAIQGIEATSAYAARTLKLLKTVYATYPSSVTVDRNNYIYVANCGGNIEVLYPGARKTAGWIHVVYGACVVVVGPDGNLYVIDGNQIEVDQPQAKPGSVKRVRTIQKGLNGPFALAFGPSGTLYVLNYPGTGYRRYVLAYPPSTDSPNRKIEDGISNPTALAVDSHETLYVANGEYSKGWVSIYGPTGENPIGRIEKGVNAPSALTIDSNDNLYVGNFYRSDVTVYAPNGKEPIRRIRQGVEGPGSLVIGD